MVSWENLVFDPTLYGLSALLISLLLYTFAVDMRSWKARNSASERSPDLGIGIIALGTLVSFGGAISLIVLLRSSLIGGILYQQVQFAIGYIGSAIILRGLQKAILPNDRTNPQFWSRIRLTLLTWMAFLVSTGISCAYLLNPSSYSIIVSGGTQHVAQETIFWLPVFTTITIGLAGILARRIRHEGVSELRPDLWLGLFLIFALIGILRESNLAPSSGDPFIDLMTAFVPFALAGIFLTIGAKSIASAKPAHGDVEVPTLVGL